VRKREKLLNGRVYDRATKVIIVVADLGLRAGTR